jgi:hypothetical protein
MKNARIRRTILLITVSALPLVAFLVFGDRFLHVSTDRSDLKADAVVVMAGAPSEDKRRIEAAIGLYHERNVRYLILPMRHPTFTWSWAVSTYHLPSSVPPSRILIGRSGDADEADLATYGGTFVEARKAAALLSRHGLRAAVVVSSAYHMRRSQIAFDQMSVDPSVHFFYHPVGKPDPLWWTRTKKRRRILREYQKLIAALLLYPSG